MQMQKMRESRINPIVQLSKQYYPKEQTWDRSEYVRRDERFLS